jgi:hypothetical protein
MVWNELEGCEIDAPKLPCNEFDEIYAVDGGVRTELWNIWQTRVSRQFSNQKRL